MAFLEVCHSAGRAPPDQHYDHERAEFHRRGGEEKPTALSLPAGSRRANWRVRLPADPIGGSAAIRAPALLVAPGQNVYWTIGSDNASSYASAA